MDARPAAITKHLNPSESIHPKTQTQLTCLESHSCNMTQYKIFRITFLQKTGGGVVILLTSFPKRESRPSLCLVPPPETFSSLSTFDFQLSTVNLFWPIRLFPISQIHSLPLTPSEVSKMLVVMQSHATEEQVRAVCQRIESLGLKAHPIPEAARTAIGITANDGAIDLGVLESLPGVIECIPVSKPYKLVSRDAKAEDTILRIPTPRGDVLIGGPNVALVAGPCAVETEAQCMAIAEQVAKTGCKLFRGGAYKPRTSPYSFQGLGEPGLKILAK